MERKIVSVDISPDTNDVIYEGKAGAMWEHNATEIVFNIDERYRGDYKYYIEYRSILGTKVRTEYLELNTETNTVTYNVPVTMSSLRGVECWFNIVMIDEDGNTVQIIKPRKFYLEFDYSPDTDNYIAKVNDFSVNALLEAIRLGTFKGDKGDKGEVGAKGEKGDKGEPGEVTLEYADQNYADAIRKTVSGNPLIIEDASPVEHSIDIKTSANETVYVRGKNLIPFNNKAYYNGNYAAGQTYVINGVSFTVNDDGSVYASGTATGSAAFVLYRADAYKNGIHTVTFSGAPENASKTTYFLRLKTASESTANYEDYGNGITVGNVNLTGSTVSIIVLGGQSVDATFYPMLEFGKTASEFISPEETQSAIADESGIVSGIELRKITSIYTETDSSVELTYKQETRSALESIDKKISDITENQGYRLINTITLNENSQYIAFTTDADGNNIETLHLRKVFILFTGSFVNTTTSQPIFLRCSNGGIYLLYKGYDITADKFYGFWIELEKILSLPDRTVYKSLYPVNMLGNFLANTGMAQGLSSNNVSVNSDLCVSRITDFVNMQLGCFNEDNLIKAGSKIYLFGK